MGVGMAKQTLFGTVCAVTLALGFTLAEARAEDRQFGYAVTVAGGSDYIFRGISYTDESPTVSLYTEINYGIAYVAFWTSNIDYYPLGPWEQDFYLGIRPVTGPVSWDLAAYYYTYGNKDGSTSDVDYVEFKIGATATPVTNLTAGATVWLQPDQGYAAAENISVEGSLAYALPKIGVFEPSISGLLGHSESGTNRYYPTGYWLGEDSYTYWNAGLKVTVEKFFMDFRYWDTTIDDAGLADSRFVFSAGFNLMP
jgi:uncharacterized protein (TIGR02001 family)